MLPRFLSLLLVLAMALLSRSALTAPPQFPSKMSCCALPRQHQSCPDCPASARGTHHCCAATTTTVWLALPTPQFFVFGAAKVRYTIGAESFPTRSARPLLPPPKVA